MRCARILSIGLVATVVFAWSAAAMENAHELARFCQGLERGAEGAGRHIYIPRTREALTCWGYMQAMQTSHCSPMRRATGLWELVRRSRRRRCSSFNRLCAMRAAHRIELAGNAVVVVFRALREVYPCRAEHAD